MARTVGFEGMTWTVSTATRILNMKVEEANRTMDNAEAGHIGIMLHAATATIGAMRMATIRAQETGAEKSIAAANDTLDRLLAWVKANPGEVAEKIAARLMGNLFTEVATRKALANEAAELRSNIAAHHFTSQEILDAAVEIGGGWKVTEVHLERGQTAYHGLSTKYSWSGPGVVVYRIHASGWNIAVDDRVRQIYAR